MSSGSSFRGVQPPVGFPSARPIPATNSFPGYHRGIPFGFSDPRLFLSDRASEECERVKKRVSGFDWKTSPAWIYLSETYGPKLKQDELVSIAEAVTPKINIKLDRDARRRKSVIVKWFQDHWLSIQPFLCRIILDER
jgi:hypothetical protein